MGLDATNATILIVEDNADNLFIILDLVRSELKAKYVNGRASGKELFKLLEKNQLIKPDLILLDLQIPYEDGFRVLQRIREAPKLSNTTVVAVTANITPHDVEKTRQSGFDGFIGKPIHAERFPKQIQRILNGEAVWEPV